MYNTPPCWCIYMTGLVLKYLENDIGGLANMQKINEAKAKVLYDYLDGQEFFTNPVEHRYRSTMNVTFTSPNPDLDKKFCAEAPRRFVNLKATAWWAACALPSTTPCQPRVWTSWWTSWRSSARRTHNRGDSRYVYHQDFERHQPGGPGKAEQEPV